MTLSLGCAVTLVFACLQETTHVEYINVYNGKGYWENKYLKKYELQKGSFYGRVLQNPNSKSLWNIMENKYFFCMLKSRFADRLFI